MKVSGQFQYTYDDYREAIQAISKSAGKSAPGPWKFSRIAVGWVLFLGLAIMLFILMRQRQAASSAPVPPPPPPTKTDPMQIVLPILPWVLVFGFVWFFIFRQLRGAQQKQWDKLPHMHRPRTIEVDDDGITLTTSASQMRLLWAHFQKFEETQSLFMLYIAETVADFIPKRAFADQQTIDGVRDLFERSISAPTSAFPVAPLSNS